MKQGVFQIQPPAQITTTFQKTTEIIIPALATSSLLLTGQNISYRYKEPPVPEEPPYKPPEYRLYPGAGPSPRSSGGWGSGRKKTFGRSTRYAPSVLGKLEGLKASKSFKAKKYFTGLEVRGI
jgi:hypothetical protein